MLLANSYLRAIILGLVSLGMIVPAWATQPCKCGKKEAGCAIYDATKHDAIKPSCCAEKPCCLATVSQDRVVITCVAESVGCPCCTEAAPPINSASQQSFVVPADQQPVAVVATLPTFIPSIAAINYLARNLGTPLGHSGLRLHALYRVWLI